jgi:hypothetical protein
MAITVAKLKFWKKQYWWYVCFKNIFQMEDPFTLKGYNFHIIY